MQDRGDVLRKFVRLLDEIEDNRTTEKEVEFILKDGTIFKVIISPDRERGKPLLKIVKPS